MKRRATIGLVLAVLFTLANVAGGIYAVAVGEPLHATLHVVLTIAGVWMASRIRARQCARAASFGASETQPRELTSRLSNLEQSLDAIALEVERVGEGQRYVTQLFAQRERDEKPR